MRKHVLVLVAAIGLIGCGGGGSVGSGGGGGGGTGGGGGGGGGSTVSISIDPTSFTLTSGQTKQFSAKVTGSSNTNVAWTATDGSISPSGLFTAPTTCSNSDAVMITATSQADSTKSAKAAVTVNVGTIAITKVSISNFSLDYFAVVGGIEVDGSGFGNGCHVNLQGGVGLGGAQLVSNTKLMVTLSIDTPHWVLGVQTIQVCSKDGSVCSNVAPTAQFVFFGNQNPMATDLADGFVNDNEAAGDLVRKFKLSSGSQDGTFAVGSGTIGIAYDNLFDYILMTAWTNGAGAFSVSGQQMSYVSTGNNFGAMAVAAKDGIGCADVRNLNTFFCADLSQFAPTSTPVAIGKDLWGLSMAHGCGETDVYAHDREGTQLARYSTVLDNGNVDMALQKSVTLTGGTPASQIHNMNAAVGNWYVAGFDSSCMAAVFAPVLNADNTISDTVTFVDGGQNGAMQQLGPPIVVPANAYRMEADNVHGTVVVAYDDPIAGLTRFVSVDPQGTVTKLQSTSPIRGAGMQISADGSTIYLGLGQTFGQANNQ